MQSLEPAEQVAVARRCGWLNVTPLGRRDIMHLHGLFFCLRPGCEEEHVLARRLATIAEDMPPSAPHEPSCWADLRINGEPAQIQEDERLWATAVLFCTNRPRPDDTWHEQGTLEFTLNLPHKWRRQCAATRLQAAVRGALARKRLARQRQEQAESEGLLLQLDLEPVEAGEAVASQAANDESEDA